ncbi:MAG: DUF3857 domain-containing protein [Chitinophagaceae bacterium]|nr:DUF3857 domain-containing protein [Chitinophagaceae bacterium]
MYKVISTLFLLLLISNSRAQLPLTVNQIPDSLKKDVDAVYQLEEMICSIESPSFYKLKVHNIITILTKQGRRHGAVQVGTDKFIKLDDAEVTVYDSTGKEFKSYKKRDFSSYGGNDASTIASDNKVLDLDYIFPGYPYSIDIAYTVHVSSYLDVPEWFFGSSDASLITSRYIVETKNNQQIRYKTYNSDMKPVISSNGSANTYTWQITGRKKPHKEPGSFGRIIAEPWVDVSPVNFQYDGYAGSLASWNDFGKLFYPFYEEANPFTLQRKAYFQSIADKGSSTREKIKLLYSYLQNETRYVSIQFGIGGYKPFPVAFAEEKKYGDCKGLTHYMKHILQAAGIKAYPAVINAGTNEYPVDPAFASNRFNHVILCVPDGKDTIWLECTSKDNYPGVLGAFTENRNALLLTEKGGLLVKTPSSNSQNNIWTSHTEVELFDDGGAIVKSRMFLSGDIWTPFFYLVTGKSKDDIKKALVTHFQYKAPDDLEVKIIGDSADGHLIECKFAYSQFYDFKSGSKYFLPLRNFKLNDEDVTSTDTRVFDYLFDYPYIKTDSTVYILPNVLKKENLPETKTIENEVVSYQRTTIDNTGENKLIVSSRLHVKKHVVPAAGYKDVAKLFELIQKDENQKIVLKKQ